MRTNYSINKYSRILFYALIATVLIGFVWAQKVYPSERDEEIGSENLIYEGDFFWEKPDGSREQITIPGEYDISPGQVMAIETILPEDYADSTIGIRASQQSIRFYIDGELRSEYDTKDSRPFGSESTSRYVFCKTSAADAGKKLRIELTSQYGLYSGTVNQIFSGDKIDIWTHIFGIYGIETGIGFFLLFAGIITVVISIALGIGYGVKVDLEYLGWCLIVGAMWLICESKLRQLFIPNASIMSSMAFVVVMLAPIPVLFYFDSVQHGQYRKWYKVLVCAAILNLVLSSALQFAEIADYLKTLFISHGILVATFLTVLVTFIQDYRKGRTKEYSLIVIAALIGMLSVTIEVVAVYFVTYAPGIILGTGLVLVLFFAVIKTIKDIRDMEKERQVQEMEERGRRTEAMTLQMIQTLSTTIETRDEYTQGHSYRVAEYCVLIAREMGWNDAEVENLRRAACLHDIGKIGVPDTILNKPTQLLDEEYEIIKKHTTIGADILKNITLIDYVEEVAKYHHERYDGHGYPEGLSGESIPIQARIVAVADSYDAMSSRRIYRNALPRDVIRQEIDKNKGIQFDPVIADIFLKLFDENRIQIDEDYQNVPANDNLSEFERNKTMEAGKFISNVMDTMKQQKVTESTDYLTGLPMRNLGEKQIAMCMREHAGCLIFLDMDNLKKINDIYGHKAGDKALKLLGDTICEYAGDEMACRLGGDEFLFFLKDVTRETAEEIVKQIFDTFNKCRKTDVTIQHASLSGGLCMSAKNDDFAECYVKADKALYFVKRNGKNDYSFYHQIEQNHEEQPHGKDLAQLMKSLRESGSYTGALDLNHREFAQIYEFIGNLGERYQHTCHLLMITMDAISDNTMFIEEIERAMDCMETSIRNNIRSVDICTRYSSMQYLVILMEAGDENIPLVVERIFNQYYKIYSRNDFKPRYEFMPMTEAADTKAI